MTDVILYHNPRCSKSRETLALLEQRGHRVQVIQYLKQPPQAAELQQLKQQLGYGSWRDLMRSNEPLYQSLQLAEADQAALLEALEKAPILLQRPIVVVGHQARIGRPPEAVLEILP